MSLQRLLAILALCLLFAAPAHAKKGIMVFNTGDELFSVAPFPADVVKDSPAAKDYQAGYKCSHFGLLWADVWTWDCKLVAVTGEDSYASLPEDVANKLTADPQYAFSKAKRGFWNHYAFWTLIGGILLFFVWGMVSGSKEKEPEAGEAAAS
jgi:hypothetical protein